MNLTPEAQKQIKEIGHAMTLLSENPAYKVLEQFEKDTLEDLKTNASKTNYLNGMVEGIRRLLFKKEECLTVYRKLIKEESNVRREPTKPITTTYGVTR